MLTFDEAKSAIEKLKKDEGLDDEKVAIVLGLMFKDGKLDVKQLDELLSIVGYELSDDFKKLPPEEQKKEENLFAIIDEK